VVQFGIDMTPINKGFYTIGYGDLTEEQFLSKLTKANITLLIDVRSAPDTERFGRRRMMALLGNKYRSVPKLGGLQYSPLRYALWRDNVLAELESIHQWSKWGAVCVMCAEAEPNRCHRTYFIGRAMKELYTTTPIHL